MRIKIVLLTLICSALGPVASAQPKTAPAAATNTPDALVRSLYDAQKADRGPFFQTKSRALVDKYFTKDFADLIWKDAVGSKGEVGAIDFDPLFNAQDMKITAFVIGKPEYDKAGSGIATVTVSFRNFGKPDNVRFLLEQDAAKNWKITDIRYKSGDMLKGMLTDALKSQGGGGAGATSGIRAVDFLNHGYPASACSEDVGLPKIVKVRGGEFKDRDNNFFNVAKDEIAYGDLNGDGSEDAAVQIRCGAGNGTLRAFEIQAYSFQGGQPKLLARLDSSAVEADYKKTFPNGIVFFPGESGPKIAGGHLFVQALTDGSFAGPANVATFDYKLAGDKFVLAGKPARRKRS